MAQQEPIRVVVERKGGCLSGCGTTLAVMVLLGLTIQYWYIALGIVAIAITAAIIRNSKERENARHRAGPRDPWLNEVAVALSDLGLVEVARNTGALLGGVQIDGDIGLEAQRLKVYVTLFSDQKRARQAELGLRAKPEVQAAVSNGATANQGGGSGYLRGQRARRGGRRISPGRSRPPGRTAVGAATAGSRRAGVSRRQLLGASQDPDVLEQLRKLGQLRSSGVLTEAEFDAKKAELLGRL